MDLYYKCWNIELYFRMIKTLIGLNFIRSKTPEMVKREIFITLISYNITRKVMCDAGSLAEVHPNRISFTKTSSFLINRLLTKNNYI